MSSQQSALEGENKRYDYLVVGAGFAGSVLAERLASQPQAQASAKWSPRPLRLLVREVSWGQ